MKIHSVLIIGCGSIGERHLRCFQQTGRARISVCDQETTLLRTVAERYRVTTAADWSEAIRGDCDAVVVCTPAQCHVPMATAAVTAGKHVLIEKPLSTNLVGVRQLCDLSSTSSIHVAIAYVYHVFPFLDDARKFLLAGGIGRVCQATVTTGSPFHRLRPGYASTYYRDHLTGGGAIQDGLTHIVNWLESILGPTESVLCDCDNLVLSGVKVEDTVHISARHKGVLVSYAFNQFQALRENIIQFNAEKGSVRIDIGLQRWGVAYEGDSEWLWHESVPWERDACFIRQAETFLDQIEGRPRRLCTLSAAAQTLRFNMAALASANRGERVLCNEFSDDDSTRQKMVPNLASARGLSSTVTSLSHECSS